jgi:hypothetical protein
MSNSTKVAMVAALEREVRPLVKRWRTIEREYEGRRLSFSRAGRLCWCVVASELKLLAARPRL